ncbi:MAG: hypothetical protein JWN33_392 [Candidatus Saccharibacteria bacterium]|nr:hypothetical protein [Candidatus Saccharibacteria bacterium]
MPNEGVVLSSLLGLANMARAELRERLSTKALGNGDSVAISDLLPSDMNVSTETLEKLGRELDGYHGRALPPDIPYTYKYAWDPRLHRLTVFMPARPGQPST